MRRLILVSFFIFFSTVAISETKILFTESTPTNELLLVKCRNNIMFIQLYNGAQEQWSKKYTYDCLSGISISADKDHVYFTSQGNVLHSLTKKNGTMEWALPLPPNAGTIAQVFSSYDFSQVIVSANKLLYIVDSRLGVPVDIVDIKVYNKNIVATKDGYSFFTGSYPYKYIGLDLNFAPSFEYTSGLSYSSNLQVSPKSSIAAVLTTYSTSGKLLNAVTGKEICDFRHNLSGTISSSVLSDDSIYYSARNYSQKIAADCSVTTYPLTRPGSYSTYGYPLKLKEDGELLMIRESTISSKTELELLRFDAEGALLESFDLTTPANMIKFDHTFSLDSSGKKLTFVYVDEKLDDAFAYEQELP